MINPNTPTTKMLMGYKGQSFLDAGYVYAPHVPIYASIMHDSLIEDGCLCNNEHKGFEMVRIMVEHICAESNGFLVKLEENRTNAGKYFKFEIGWLKLKKTYKGGIVKVCLEHNTIKLLKHYTASPSVGWGTGDRSEWDNVMEYDLNNPNSIQELTNKILEVKEYVFK